MKRLLVQRNIILILLAWIHKTGLKLIGLSILAKDVSQITINSVYCLHLKRNQLWHLKRQTLRFNFLVFLNLSFCLGRHLILLIFLLLCKILLYNLLSNFLINLICLIIDHELGHGRGRLIGIYLLYSLLIRIYILRSCRQGRPSLSLRNLAEFPFLCGMKRYYRVLCLVNVLCIILIHTRWRSQFSLIIFFACLISFFRLHYVFNLVKLVSFLIILFLLLFLFSFKLLHLYFDQLFL